LFLRKLILKCKIPMVDLKNNLNMEDSWVHSKIEIFRASNRGLHSLEKSLLYQIIAKFSEEIVEVQMDS